MRLENRSGFLEGTDHCELEVRDDVLRDPLDVLGRDGIQPREHRLGLLRLAQQHLAAQPVHDRPVRALDAEHEAALRERAGLLELIGGHRLLGDPPELPAIVVTASSMRWMSTPAWA